MTRITNEIERRACRTDHQDSGAAASGAAPLCEIGVYSYRHAWAHGHSTLHGQTLLTIIHPSPVTSEARWARAFCARAPTVEWWATIIGARWRFG
jgi:hypothetical protein